MFWLTVIEASIWQEKLLLNRREFKCENCQINVILTVKSTSYYLSNGRCFTWQINVVLVKPVSFYLPYRYRLYVNFYSISNDLISHSFKVYDKNLV